MVTRFYPLIDCNDYETFRHLLNGQLPASHAEWEQFLGKQMSDTALHGHIAKGVKVEPDKFAAFCAARGESPDLRLLDLFAHFIGTDLKNRHD